MSLKEPRNPRLRYGVAVAMILLATVLRLLLLQPVVGTDYPFVTFFVTVLLTAWYAGLGPALLALFLGCLATAGFVFSPGHPLAGLNAHNASTLGISSGIGLLSILVIESLRSAERRAARSTLEAMERQRELERAIAARREAETDQARLAAIVASSHNAIIGKTLDGVITSWNAGAERLYGHPAEEVIGRTIDLLLPPGRPDEVPQILDRLRHGERVGEYETVRVRKDGARIDIALTVSPIQDSAGRIVGAATIARDITERKRVDAALRFLAQASQVLASSLDYEATLASVAHLAVPHIADWCSVDMVGDDGAPRNLAVAHIDPEKVAWAQALQQRYPPDPHAKTGLPEVLRTGRAETYPEIPEEMLVAAAIDAEHLRVIRELEMRSAMVVPLRARDQTLGAITLVSTEPGRRYGDNDLHLAEDLAGRAAIAIDNARLYQEAREAQEALRQKAAALLEADRQKDEFLAMLGHELRTPLAAIGTSIEIVRRRSAGRDETEPVYARIERQVARMARLIDDLQDVSRIARGKISLRREPLDLVRLVRETVEDQLAAFEQAGLTLKLELPEAPVCVPGDTTRLAQVLVNLLHNALKFTDPGGQVSVALTQNDHQVEVTVRDSGIGIDPEVLPRIFESFVQAERSLDRSRGGLGLGLALVKGLVELHHGEVRVSSGGAGKGTEFTFRLPLAEMGTD